MKKLMLLFISVLVLTFASTTETFAQKTAARKTITVKAKSGSGDSEMTMPSDDKVRPKATKKRGYCYLYFDNPTGYYVNVWVAGEYQGQLPPYSSSNRVSVWTSGNWTRWDARTIGGTYQWGNDSYCNDNRGWKITL